MEKLKIEIKKDLNLYPPVIGYLASIGECEYSYKYYKLRHPGGIFLLQLGNLIDDFLELLNDLKEFQSKQKNEVTRINKKYACLLSSFFKYYEACYEIILGCCKQHDPPSEKEFIHTWLKRNNYTAGQIFFNKVKDDTEYFRQIYNKLKHTSNDLRILSFSNEHMRIAGYYLESVNDEGLLGPDEILHPRFNDQHTANSFNFDLRRVYYCIYKIANALNSVLIQHFREVHSIDLCFNNEWVTKNMKLKNLYDEINNLHEFYFPNEFNKPIPIPSIKNKNDSFLIFEIEEALSVNLSNFKVEYTTRTDGFSRLFRLPYF